MGAVRDGIKAGPAGMVAMEHSLKIQDLLKSVLRELQLAREMQFGLFHYELLFGGEATGAEKQLQATEPIPPGYVFIPQHIAAKAPEGAQLELFENNVTPSNFIEVITNVQTFANMIGGLILEGPTNVIAVLTKMKATGAISISISGLLVPSHIAAPEPSQGTMAG